jgi:hypothetical protein
VWRVFADQQRVRKAERNNDAAAFDRRAERRAAGADELVPAARQGRAARRAAALHVLDTGVDGHARGGAVDDLRAAIEVRGARGSCDTRRSEE